MATNVIKEINSVRAFFKAREHLSVGDGDDGLRKCFTDAIIKQLNMVSVFSTQDAGHVTECLKDSPYDCHTHRVISAIEAKLKSNQSVGSGAASSAANQFLKCWWAVLTQGDWDFIRDKRKSWDAKMTKVVERANLLGVTHPSEQSLKWLLALLLVVCYDELPSYATIFKKLGDLKQCVEAERKGYPLEHLLTYPATPQELSGEMFKYAYGDAQPIFMHLSGINVVAEHNIPLRKNSKLLKGSKSPPPDVSDSFSSLKREVAGEDTPTLKLEHREGSLPSVKATLKACKVEDSDEEALLLEYQAKLIKLKREKRHAASAHNAAPHSGLVTAPPPEQSPSSGELQRVALHVGDGGTIVLSHHPDATPLAGDVPRVKAEPVADTTPTEDDDKPHDDGDLRGLDAYARAAINALKSGPSAKKLVRKLSGARHLLRR
jgi:hypothetical protein